MACDLGHESKCTSKSRLSRCYCSFFHNFTLSTVLHLETLLACKSLTSYSDEIDITLLSFHTANSPTTKYQRLLLFLFSSSYHSCLLLSCFSRPVSTFMGILYTKFLLISNLVHLLKHYILLLLQSPQKQLE